MKIVIPGGAGQVGALLARVFQQDGHEVVVLSRSPRPMPWRVVRWDPAGLAGLAGLESWAGELDGADVVINLAGRSVNCRYTPEHRREILASRVRSVQAVGQAIAAASRPPAVWLQMSTATIYAHRYDTPNDESTGLLGGEEPGAPDTRGGSALSPHRNRADPQEPPGRPRPPSRRRICFQASGLAGGRPGSVRESASRFPVAVSLLKILPEGTIHEFGSIRRAKCLANAEEALPTENIPNFWIGRLAAGKYSNFLDRAANFPEVSLTFAPNA
jgi:NAD(P)-dependent dehydrogenase (short-subunit alcohol dehydrogenase family)